MRLASLMAAICLCFATAARVAAQSSETADEARAKSLATDLASTDRATVDRAVNEIHTLYESDPEGSVGFYRKYWLPSLVSASQFDLAERLAFDGILAAPWHTASVEFLQETRVRMLLRGNHSGDALSNARSLFNVVSLGGTERALLLMAECLKSANNGDTMLLRRFAREQLAGATTRPISEIEPNSALMESIPIDPSPYAAAISQYISDDDQSRLAKGNLLLLAGRCDEAKSIFEAMDRLSGADRVHLTENVARAIRASDGTIGRANGFMLSHAGNEPAE